MTEQYILQKNYVHPKSRNAYYASSSPVTYEHLSVELRELLQQDPSFFLVINKKDPNIKLVEEVVNDNHSIITKKINSSETEIQATKTVVKTNINTATQEQLKSIPNLTTTLVSRIMEMRPFTSYEELSKKIPLQAGKSWNTYPIFLDPDESKS